MNLDKPVAELVHRSCLCLDEMDFPAFLELCAPDFHYKVTAYSPEIRKDMVWQEVDKGEMKHHLDLIPRHVRDNSSLSRHAVVCAITYSDDGSRAHVMSTLQIFRTKKDGGETSLFGVGRMRDVVDLADGTARLLDRELRMETRQLGIGSQVPL